MQKLSNIHMKHTALVSNCTHKFRTATEPNPQSLTLLFQHPTNCQQDYRVDGELNNLFMIQQDSFHFYTPNIFIGIYSLIKFFSVLFLTFTVPIVSSFDPNDFHKHIYKYI